MISLCSPILAFVAFGMGREQTPARSGRVYWAVVAAVGASLGVIVLAYTTISIAVAFLASAAGFGALSLMGYATKRNLAAHASFLITGLFGLIVALGLNLVLHNGLLGFAINLAGVLIFAGLIAHDTQRLKLSYYECTDDPAQAAHSDQCRRAQPLSRLHQPVRTVAGLRRRASLSHRPASAAVPRQPRAFGNMYALPIARISIPTFEGVSPISPLTPARSPCSSPAPRRGLAAVVGADIGPHGVVLKQLGLRRIERLDRHGVRRLPRFLGRRLQVDRPVAHAWFLPSNLESDMQNYDAPVSFWAAAVGTHQIRTRSAGAR
jgi:hypothetical protein